MIDPESGVKREYSCGAVVFTRDGGEVRFVIVEGEGGRAHGFPKGHMEKGETELDTALREIREETSLEVRIIDGFRTEEEYIVPQTGTLKRVVYFFAEYSGQTPAARPGEIRSVSVLPFDEAMALFEHESTRRILREANEFIKNL